MASTAGFACLEILDAAAEPVDRMPAAVDAGHERSLMPIRRRRYVAFTHPAACVPRRNTPAAIPSDPLVATTGSQSGDTLASLKHVEPRTMSCRPRSTSPAVAHDSRNVVCPL